MGACALKEAAACGKAHTRAGSWQELQPEERSPHWSRFDSKTCDPRRGTKLEQCVPEGLIPMEWTHD